MANNSARRDFIKFGAAAIATARFPILGANDRISVGIVGLGGRGTDHTNFYSKLPNEARISSVCDVNQAARERGVALVKKLTGGDAKEYADMRSMFDSKDVDAVSITTPNHWHALATIWACQAGKDVYVEKPASHNVYEGFQMVKAARKYNRMVQVGSQSRSIPYKMKAIQLLQDGIIGQVYAARAQCFRRRFSIGHSPDEAVPRGLDWGFFLGPAQWKPYSKNKFAYNWHWFWDTGNGETGNNGPHYTDIARWILKKHEHPVRAQSMGNMEIPDSDQETPSTQISTLEYADKTRLQIEVRNWYTNAEDGLRMGLLVYGSEGWMNLGTDDWAVYFGRKNEPGPKLTEKEADAKVETFNAQGTGEAPHLQNFINCVRSRKRTELKAEVEEGHYSTALCHLANIAYRTGRTVNFDSKQERFIGDQEANALLTRASYRAPFVVPSKV